HQQDRSHRHGRRDRQRVCARHRPGPLRVAEAQDRQVHLQSDHPPTERDGFWHYSLLDKDPQDKDVLGYFMLTTKELMDLQKFNPAYREEKLNAALQK